MFLIIQILFDFYIVMLRCVKMTCANIGPSRLVGASPIERKVVGRHMEIPYVSIVDLPRLYQCQTAGVSGRFARLLRRVA